MATIINASNTTGLTLTSDLSGVLQLQQNGVAMAPVSVAPAFGAYANTSTTVTSGGYTKINYNYEDFDTNSNYSSSRFTPTVAGYYQISAGIGINTTPTSIYCIIYKNGTAWIGNYTSATTLAVTISALVYLNGSTDYVEIYGSVGSTQGTYNDRTQTFFTGGLVRAA